MLNNDDFEPFLEQKKTCSKLIRYLKKLKSRSEPVSTSESVQTASTDAESSADEFPESFKMLKVGTSDQPSDSTMTYSKKKSYVKKYVKKTLVSSFKYWRLLISCAFQPISHSIDYLNLFNAINVEFPKTYADLETAITNVEEAFKFFNEQTSLDMYDNELSPFSSSK